MSTSSVKVADVPAGRTPTVHLTGGPRTQLPREAELETTGTACGAGSVSTTPVASDAPLIVTVIA
jgi:hypothetical protein